MGFRLTTCRNDILRLRGDSLYFPETGNLLIYLIDAFNLIHKIERIVDSPTPHGDLVKYLAAGHLTGSHRNRVVVVFDGYEPKGQLLDGPFEVTFSKGGTADDVIKKMIEKASNKRQFVVVSDDRSIREYAGAEGAKVMHTEEFLHTKTRTGAKVKADAGDEKPVDEEVTERITREMEEVWVKRGK